MCNSFVPFSPGIIYQMYMEIPPSRFSPVLQILPVRYNGAFPKKHGNYWHSLLHIISNILYPDISLCWCNKISYYVLTAIRSPWKETKENVAFHCCSFISTHSSSDNILQASFPHFSFICAVSLPFTFSTPLYDFEMNFLPKSESYAKIHNLIIPNSSSSK